MNAGPVLIGIDLGTTACKCLVFSAELEVLGAAARALELVTRSGSEIEQDAEQWWQATAGAVREAVAEAGVEPARVRGLGISAQGISVVPVDGELRPLRSAFSWMDTRAKEQRRQVLEALTETEIFSITGKRCHEAYVLPKLLWFRQHQPELYARSRYFLMPLEFLTARLTGQVVTDHTMASGTMIYDINRGEWSARIVEAFSLEAETLPPLSWGGTPAGRLRPAAARELGLSEEVVVAVGGQDQKVAALGAGIDLARTTVSLGTAMAITQKNDRPVIDRDMRLPCFADLFQGRWVLEGSGPACSVLDWLKRTLFPLTSYAELDRMAEAEEEAAEPLLLFPFFSGASSPHYSPDARGFLYGLNFAASAGQLVRGVLEGSAFQIAENLEVMEAISRPAQELRVFGGGSRSEVWCRIIAEATAVPVVALGTSEAASTGAAILAGLGAGLYGSPEDAFRYLQVRRLFEPRPQAVERYRELRDRWRGILTRVLGGG